MMSSIRFVLRPLLAAVLLAGAAALPACETTKKGFPESGSPSNDPNDPNRRKQETTSRLVATIGEKGLVQYRIPREQLAQGFNRQFGDGTSIDKTMVRKVQGGPKEPAFYYLVGLGLHNGMFRGMALPLKLTTDNELYLSSGAARYIITGVSCTFCFSTSSEMTSWAPPAKKTPAAAAATCASSPPTPCSSGG